MAKWTDPFDVRRLGEWSFGTGPMYGRLAQALETAIDAGDLPVGARLPPERPMADALGVSRTTVVLAYRRLRSTGVVESRQGSGTFVARGSRPRARRALREDTSRSFLVDSVTRAAAEEPAGTISFMGACLPAADDLLAEAWEATREDVRGLGAHAGYSPQGLPALRQALAARFAQRGLPTTPDQVLITGGAQQAIDLVARQLTGIGRSVVLEDPTYLGAIDAFALARARLLSLPVGPAGADVDALRRLVEQEAPALCYLVPTFHNPTGTLLPEGSRRAVARLAEDTGTTILEDESLAELSFATEPPPPIAAFAPRAPVLTVGSMSKLFWGGLRVGWIRGPRPLIARLTRLKVTADLSGSVVSQALAIRALPHRDEIARRRRRESLARLELLATLLHERLPEWTFTRPEGGLNLWVRLPVAAAEELARAGIRHGVSVVPGGVHSPSGACRDHVRLPFVLQAEQLREGVDRLARAWDACRGLEGEKRLGVIV